MNEFQEWQKYYTNGIKFNEWNYNQRLYDQPGGYIIHILNYSEKQNIPLGNKDILYQLIQKAERIIDEVEILTSADESLQSNKNKENRRRLNRTLFFFLYIL
jgi:hypothetical protein